MKKPKFKVGDVVKRNTAPFEKALKCSPDKITKILEVEQEGDSFAYRLDLPGIMGKVWVDELLISKPTKLDLALK